ncbi:family 1 glycosylhydrolase [Aerococcaceae bacterium zg-ZUI334]|uniref:glycoside hydrolase family 1 protein n=1 Tax=Aerococcaceae bacterium zg-252 TaxID=2796928 RepID=UPI001B9343BB|nr:family 1 glycosylhydrolase [Aerococcaceae bacterium zg-ZUI334]
MSKFPKNFLLGAATAAHQVEGNNTNSDCWAQEQMPHSTYKERSGIACDHYNRYAEDIKLMKNAGLNAYRFSIEWARIQPEEGVFDDNVIDHYRNVIQTCHENGLEPVVTLFHFSSPIWIIRKGGWEADTIVEDFEKYVTYVIKSLGSELTYVCTINEANMGLQVAAISRHYMKMMQQAAEAATSGQDDGKIQMGLNLEAMMENMKFQADENEAIFGTSQPHCFNLGGSEHSDMLTMQCHQAAKKVIKSMYPNIQVGLTLSLHDFQPVDGGEALAKAEWEEEFTHYVPFIQDDDFLGVQNYTRTLVGPDEDLGVPENAERTQMGYEYYPQGLENVIRAVAKDFKGNLIVTENGIASADDSRRMNFIQTATDGVVHCIEDGIPVKGYFYWSLLDNFEWQMGYQMQFGLVSVNRDTMERSPKESLGYLGSLLSM